MGDPDLRSWFYGASCKLCVDPSPCVSYQGCDQGYPVTWCEWDGDHYRPSLGNSAVAAFFKQF